MESNLKADVLNELIKAHESGEIDSMDEFLREINSLIHKYSEEIEKCELSGCDNKVEYKICESCFDDMGTRCNCA